MKYLFFLLIVAGSFFTSSYKVADLPPGRTYHIFYVDNSYSKTYGNFSPNLVDILIAKVDSLQNDRFSSIGFFLADGDRTNFASNYNGAKTYINRLSDGNTATPNSFNDRSLIVENLLNTDLSNIKNLNINLFLTEEGLMNDFLSGSNAGLLINSLPSYLQFLLNCKEENITVTVFYPETSKKVTKQVLETFTSFSSSQKDFVSKIKFNFQPI